MSEPFNIRFKYVVDCYRTCASSSVEISETESTFSMQTLAISDQNRTKAFFLRSKKVITAVFMAITSSGVPRGGVWGVQTPPEILKISVESSIA